MKTLAFVVALISLLGLLAFKNPTLDDYSVYLRQSVIQEMQKEAKREETGFLGAVLNPLVGGIASELVVSQTIRKDFIFFSTYEVAFGKERLRLLGVLKNFFILEKPGFLTRK